MTLIPINTYLLNDDTIHVVNHELSKDKYKELLKHLEVLDNLPVYINDVEYDINSDINVKIENDSKNITVNAYTFEIHATGM